MNTATSRTVPRRERIAGVAVLVITVLIGAAAAFGVTADRAPAERSLAATLAPVQSLISITVPFLGVLAVTRLWRAPASAARWRTVRTLATAAGIAVGLGAYGLAVSAGALASMPAGVGKWEHTPMLILASLLVQVIAQTTGTGFGMLLRRRLVAMAATVVVPLGLWFVLGGLQGWVTPYAVARDLLSGAMTPTDWAQVATVLLIWGVGLNAAGLFRSSRQGDVSLRA